MPWPRAGLAVQAALPERYQTMVDLGAAAVSGRARSWLAVDAIDFPDTLRVVHQVKLIRGKAVFAPPKGGKERDVPLPGPVAAALRRT